LKLDGNLLSTLVGLMEEDRETMVPTRLSILVYLYFTQNATFPVLQRKLGLTSGNLSSHLRKLEELGLIRISKRFVDLKPTTFAVITIKIISSSPLKPPIQPDAGVNSYGQRGSQKIR